MKNKIIIMIILALLLCGCENYRELNDLAIITGVSIDKKDNKYELGFLIANSQKAQTSSKEGQAQTTVYSGSGKNLTSAIKKIDAKSAKQLYYGHINVIIISEEIGKEGFLKIADNFLRDPESRKQFYLLQAKGTKAKNILKIISPLETFPSQNISDLIKSNQMTQSFSAEVSYSLFTEKILDKGIEPILPTILIYGEEEKGSKEKNIETTDPEAYLKLGSLAIYKKDKLIGYLNKSESQYVNILLNNVNEFMYNFKHKNKLLSYSTDNVKTKINIKNTNQIEVSIKSSGYLKEVNSKLNLESKKTMTAIQKSLNKQIKKGIKKTLKKLQNTYHSDIIGIGNKIYKKYPKQWEKLENKWNDKYFSKLEIKVNTNFKIEASGSLDQTIKEVLK